MNRLAIVLGLAALPFVAQAAEPAPAATPVAPAPAASEVIHRGGPFTLNEQVTLDDVAAKPDTFAGKTVKIAGQIGQVCKKKGCWLSLKGTAPTTVARVTFKDYGFFAPMDCEGKAATVEGVVEVTKLDEAERKHLAEDGKTTLESIPTNELRIVATALEIK